MERTGQPSNIEKLRHVPVFAVRNLLLSALGDDTALGSMTGDELIELVGRTVEITEANIDELFEEYRYGGRASFYLYLLRAHPSSVGIVSVDDWNNELAGLQEPTDDEGQDLDVRVIDIEPLLEGISEIRFRYTTKYKFIDSLTEEPSSINELSFGFLWLNLSHDYMVIMSKEEKAKSVIANAVDTLFTCDPVAVRFTKQFVNNNFSIEDMVSSSWHDPRNEINYRMSGENLMRNVGDDVTRHEDHFERMAGMYKEAIPDGRQSRLGMHLDKGKIYLSRLIAATDLREWMYTRLHPLILSLGRLGPADAVQMTTQPLPELGLSSDGEHAFRQIAGLIIGLRETAGQTAVMTISTGKLYHSMRSYFFAPEPRIYCEECENDDMPRCSHCGSDRMQGTTRGFRCEDCGHAAFLPNVVVTCSRNHTVWIDHPENHLVLRPKHNLQTELARFMRAETNIVYNPDEEFFWIRDGQLHYITNPNPVALLPEDLDEYRRLPERSAIDSDLWNRASGLMLITKEKCQANNGSPTADNCRDCFEHNRGRICLPKVFRAINPSFMPIPHSGLEFGDISMDVAIHGARKVLLGMLKSASAVRRRSQEQGSITSSEANSWVSQIVRQAIRDQRVEVFALATPRALNEEFTSSVKMLAKMSYKPFVVFGHEELTRMMCALLQDSSHAALRDLL